MPQRSSLRRRLALLAVATATAAPATPVGAQLAYDSTTFLHGLGSGNAIWQGQYPALGYRTPPQYLRSRVYLKGVGTPWLDEGGPVINGQRPGLRYADQQKNLVRYLTAAAGQHVLVGHSAGSLVARGTFGAAGVGPQRVTGIVTVAAPHQGAHIADSAEVAVAFVEDMQNRIKAAERNVKIYVAASLWLSASIAQLWYGIGELLTALELQNSGGDLPTGGITGIPKLELIKDLGPRDSAVVALKDYWGDGSVPRANIRGSIPYAHAILRLAAASGPTSFAELKARKDKGLALLRKCKNLGNWTLNLSDPGNRCQRAANMLNALDPKWAAWVNGTTCDGVTPGGTCARPQPRRIPFDGIVPNERSNYPTTNGLVADATVPGMNHQTIYRERDGLNAVATAMLDMGMVQSNGLAVSLSGPWDYRAAQTLTWQAAATGGPGAYTYAWSYRPSGASTWTPFGTGSASASLTVNTTMPSFTVRVRVVSGGQALEEQRSIQNASGGGCVQQPGGPPCPL